MPEAPPNEAALRGTEAHSIAADILRNGGTLPPGFEKLAVYLNFVWPLAPVVETVVHHPRIKDFWGTVDARVETTPMLHIIDLKWGKWNVEAKDNAQLMSYSVLARTLHPNCDQYQGTIVQPNVPKQIKTTTYSKQQLDDFDGQVALVSFREDRVPGNSQCRFCTLKPNCNEYKDARNRGLVNV